MLPRSHVPLEEGLRPIKGFCHLVSDTPRSHVPLEEGLRPEHKAPLFITCCPRSHVPLEEGLRLFMKKKFKIQLY